MYPSGSFLYLPLFWSALLCVPRRLHYAQHSLGSPPSAFPLGSASPVAGGQKTRVPIPLTSSMLGLDSGSACAPLCRTTAPVSPNPSSWHSFCSQLWKKPPSLANLEKVMRASRCSSSQEECQTPTRDGPACWKTMEHGRPSPQERTILHAINACDSWEEIWIAPQAGV